MALSRLLDGPETLKSTSNIERQDQMTSKEIRAELRATRREMKERGIRTVSCFNGGLDDGTYRANSKLFRLKLALADALKDEAKQ